MKLTLASSLRRIGHRFRHTREFFLTALVRLARALRRRVGDLLRTGDGLAQAGANRILSFAERRIATFLVLFLIGAVVFVLVTWEWQQTTPFYRESGSTTIRNLGLVIGGVVAAFLAVWRSKVAEQSLLNERYQRGAEMLGNKVLAVRLGGIYALQSLARERPEKYHVQIVRLLCAFARNPTAVDNGETGLTNHEPGEAVETNQSGAGGFLRQDVEAVLETIATRSKVGIGLERDAGFWLDFREADLSGLDLFRVEGVNLSGARLSGADLSHVKLRPYSDLSSIRESYGANLSMARLNRVSFRGSDLWKADLTCSLFVGSDFEIADLRDADLSRATLANADLSGAELRDTILSGTKFSIAEHPPAQGLTQEELDRARADPENPPKLDGVVDDYTGEPLVWRGKSLYDQA